ncbi:hypothetical protein HDU76_007934 [Blyttiomyces sp. JEL0837]|nr:hypothetical protein HDU76_007934 [Blyttiomyces sp. JEL0837]
MTTAAMGMIVLSGQHVGLLGIFLVPGFLGGWVRRVVRFEWVERVVEIDDDDVVVVDMDDKEKKKKKKKEGVLMERSLCDVAGESKLLEMVRNENLKGYESSLILMSGRECKKLEIHVEDDASMGGEKNAEYGLMQMSITTRQGHSGVKESQYLTCQKGNNLMPQC